MRKFDYSFLNNGLLPANLINLTSSIASLKTMAGVRKEEYAKIFTELEAVAKVQSVKKTVRWIAFMFQSNFYLIALNTFSPTVGKPWVAL